MMEVISVLENICKLNPQLADNPLIGLFAKRLHSVENTAEVEITEIGEL